MGCYDWIEWNGIVAQTKDLEQSFNHYHIIDNQLYVTYWKGQVPSNDDKVTWSGTLEFYDSSNRWLALVELGEVITIQQCSSDP